MGYLHCDAFETFFRFCVLRMQRKNFFRSHAHEWTPIHTRGDFQQLFQILQILFIGVMRPLIHLEGLPVLAEFKVRTPEEAVERRRLRMPAQRFFADFLRQEEIVPLDVELAEKTVRAKFPRICGEDIGEHALGACQLAVLQEACRVREIARCFFWEKRRRQWG